MSPEAEKPLFIPLNRRWFEAFLRGSKDTEYRAYGPRWNERTCRVGRLATLSLGYGKARRLRRKVIGFMSIPRDQAPAVAQEIYPNACYIAAIVLGNPALHSRSVEEPKE